MAQKNFYGLLRPIPTNTEGPQIFKKIVIALINRERRSALFTSKWICETFFQVYRLLCRMSSLRTYDDSLVSEFSVNIFFRKNINRIGTQTYVQKGKKLKEENSYTHNR